jgi:hypothetical protein
LSGRTFPSSKAARSSEGRAGKKTKQQEDAMKRFNGGTKVAGGYYFNVTSWEFATISDDQGSLPGDATQQYIHVPLLALFVVAPVLGLVFAMFLPFIGFALPIYALGKAVVGTGKEMAHEAAATVSPQWRPGEAYLAGKPGEDKGTKLGAEKAAGQDPGHLNELQAEIEKRRSEKK